MFVGKTKLIFMAFFMLVILSIGAVSATDDVSAVDTPLLNDTTVDLNQNIASPINDTVQVELMDDNSASCDVNASGNLNDINAIFEGVKVYSPGDTYNIKFIATIKI